MDVKIYINNVSIDLFKDESIRIIRKVTDVRDITKVYSDYSLPFSIPASSKNNKIYRHIYNQSVLGNDPTEKKAARIEIDTQIYKTGYVKLSNVKMDKGKAISYSLVFVSEMINIKDLLGESLISSLNLSAHDHNYTATEVKNRISAGVPVGCSLISWDNRFVYDSAGTTYSNAKNIHSEAIEYTEIKPHISMRTLLEAITTDYPELGFGTQLRDAVTPFDCLWMAKTPNIVGTEDGEKTKTVYIDGLTMSQADQDAVQIELINGSIFKFQNIAYYELITYHDFSIDIVSGSANKYTVIAYEVSTGETIREYKNLVGNQSLYLSGFEDLQVHQVAFKTTAVDVGSLTFTVKPRFRDWGNSPFVIKSTNDLAVLFVRKMIVADNLPEMKIIDLITSIFKKNNLVAHMESGALKIETVDSFFNSGNSYDITKYTERTNQTITFASPYKKIDFKFAESKALRNLDFKESNNREYGNLSYNNEGGNSDYSVELGVEVLYLDYLFDIANGDSSGITTGAYLDKDKKPMIGAPLIFTNHTNGPAKTVKFNEGGTVVDIKFPMLNNGGGGLVELFGQDGIYNFAGETDSTGFGIFDRLYKNYFARNFSKTARIKTITAHLPSWLLMTIKLNDKLIIDDTEYLINSIDSDLTTEVTKIEILNVI